MDIHTPLMHSAYKKKIRVAYMLVLVLLASLALLATSVIYTKQVAFDMLWYQTPSTANQQYTNTPFPIGVHPADKSIVEKPGVNTFLQDKLVVNKPQRPADNTGNWMRHIITKLAQLDWYQNLASPTGRILIINPGARKEEVVHNFSKILNWDTEMEMTFQSLVVSIVPAMADGKFYPTQYLVGKDTTPEEVADIITQRFNSEIATRYTADTQRLLPLDDALVIASLLEREAYDFTDMREISGIIWNRLFIDMNLQIDATLQYAKGTNSASTWYPPVRPDDKYIDSPFNTYANKGLPPAPIGSPSAAAVLAALNPIQTNCIFYFHDKNSQFHCSETYKEHVRLLKEYYGQGK